MNEHLYNRLRHEGLKCLELPTQHVNLRSAFSRKSNRVKKQAMIYVNIGDFKINQIVLLSPQLLTDAILGLDFLVDYNAVINFGEQSITLEINGECTKIRFIGTKETANKLGGTEESSENQFRDFGLVTDFPRELLSLTADRGQHPTDPSVTAKGDALVENERGGTIVSKKNKEQLIEDQVHVLISRRVSDRDEYVEFVSRYDDACRNFQSNDLNTLAKDKEGHIVDDCSSTEHEIREESRKNMNDATNKRTLCFTTTCSKTNAVDTQRKQQGLDTRQITTEDRMITAEQLRGKVSENNLSPQQQEDLYNVLIRYQQQLTKRPGKCTKFEYEFKIEGSEPTSANSRPIPFALRDQVRDQIQVMLQDDILEESFSSYINPLTLVVREMKPLRICVDARRINRQMIADRTKVLPLRELLQKFHGASYITNLDLSSAFLHVPLKETPRQWTAFQFQSKVYQFKTVPYGFKNSISAFIRALEKV